MGSSLTASGPCPRLPLAPQLPSQGVRNGEQGAVTAQKLSVR